MTTLADIIRQYTAACAAQAGQLSREGTVDDLRRIADAVEKHGVAEVAARDVFDLRDRLYLCKQGKSHWWYDCRKACR